MTVKAITACGVGKRCARYSAMYCCSGTCAVMAYGAMACIVMAYGAMACIVMAYGAMACIVMAYGVMG